MKHPLIPVSLIIFLLIIAGCTAPKKGPLPIQSASLQELLTKINTSYHSFKSIKITMEMEYIDNATPKPQECKGLLAYERPNRIYIKGYKSLIPAFFTLVSNQGYFWLHIPQENLVIEGAVTDIERTESISLGLRPNDITRSIELNLIPDSSPAYTVEMKEDKEDHYLLSVFRHQGEDKFLERQLWIERHQLNVAREVYYRQNGVIDIEIFRENYIREGKIYFPKEIHILRPDRRSSLFFETKKYAINKSLKQKLFEFEYPKGVEVEELQQ